MSRYLLDTAPIAALLRNRPGAVSLITPWMVRHEATTSIVVYGEVVEYIRGFADYQRRRIELQTLLLEIAPYRLSYAILERYAELRRQLRPPHGPGLIGDIDTLIAATALQHDLTLVTIDSDFQRVPGLKLQLLTSLR